MSPLDDAGEGVIVTIIAIGGHVDNVDGEVVAVDAGGGRGVAKW